MDSSTADSFTVDSSIWDLLTVDSLTVDSIILDSIAVDSITVDSITVESIAVYPNRDFSNMSRYFCVCRCSVLVFVTIAANSSFHLDIGAAPIPGNSFLGTAMVMCM